MTNMHLSERRIDRRTCLKAAGAAAGLLLLDRSVSSSRDVIEAAETDGQAAAIEPLTLEQSLRLAGQNLLGILNPEENYLPYWKLTVHPDHSATFDRWWPAHNIGRWLDAMLRLEDAIGFEIPKVVEAAMIENARRFFDNPDHICLNPGSPANGAVSDGAGLEWDLHSLREGLLALNALARWRKSDWAADMGRRMIQSIDGKLRDDGTWDLDAFDACRKRGKAVIHNTDPCDTHGRMLEAIIWFYETTGERDALRLAERIAKFHFANTTQPDGAINPACRADHTHSYLGTLRGLLLYGKLANERQYIDRVAAAYRVNVPRIVTEAGYTSHNMLQESFGETTSPGDVAQLALWLFLEGCTEFIDDAERLVRARILPSQIRQTPPLTPIAGVTGDAGKDLGKRIIGAYGGCHGHAHGGKSAVTDVTSADVHTLIDIYKQVTTTRSETLEVLFHFAYEDSRVRIESQRDKRAQLRLTPKTATAVAVRVPQWSPPDSIRFQVGEETIRPVYAGRFAWFGKMPAGASIRMHYALPERRTQEKGLGAEFEIFWRGDEVVGIRPNTDFYPFYPDAPVGVQ